MTLQLVWFKRDLRLHDHAPLAAAARQGPVLGVYLFEPVVFGAADVDGQHLAFAAECVVELRARLRRRGSELLLRTGEAVQQLEQLVSTLPVAAIWAHEETGNSRTYARDRRVRTWARSCGLPFHELPSGGVVRRLDTRDGWSERWDAMVRAPLVRPPARVAPLPWAVAAHGLCAPDPGEPPTAAALGVCTSTPRAHTVRGGEHSAHATPRVARSLHSETGE